MGQVFVDIFRILVYNYTRMQKRDTGMYRWSVHCPLWEKG